MGRRKEPLERVAARANGEGRTLGGRELVKPTKVVAPRNVIPDPPSELTGRGYREWVNIWRAGYWLKEDQDYPWVEMIAHAYMDIEVYRAEVKKTGLITKGYAGQDAENPLLGSIRKSEATIQKCLCILGLSPSDRARLAITEVKMASALQQMIMQSNGPTDGVL